MGSAQHFSLKWNKHKQNWNGFLDRLLNTHVFSDVIVACDGRLFNLHRIVLASCSSYFEEALQNIPVKETPVVMLSDVSVGEMDVLVKFMYSGEVTVEQPLLEPLLKAAERLNIKGLVKSDTDSSDSSDTDETMTGAQSGAVSPPTKRQKRRSSDTDGCGGDKSNAAASLCVNGGADGGNSDAHDSDTGELHPLTVCQPETNAPDQDSDDHHQQTTTNNSDNNTDKCENSNSNKCSEVARLLSHTHGVCIQPVLPTTSSSSSSTSTSTITSTSPRRITSQASDTDDVKPHITITPFRRGDVIMLPAAAGAAAGGASTVAASLRGQRPRFIGGSRGGSGGGSCGGGIDKNSLPSVASSLLGGLSKRNSADSPQVRAALLQISTGQVTVAEASIKYDIPIPTLYVNMRRAGIKARGRVSMTGVRKPRGILSVEMSHALEEIRRGTITASKASRKYNITLPRIMSWMRKMGIRSAFAKSTGESRFTAAVAAAAARSAGDSAASVSLGGGGGSSPYVSDNLTDGALDVKPVILPATGACSLTLSSSLPLPPLLPMNAAAASVSVTNVLPAATSSAVATASGWPADGDVAADSADTATDATQQPDYGAYEDQDQEDQEDDEDDDDEEEEDDGDDDDDEEQEDGCDVASDTQQRMSLSGNIVAASHQPPAQHQQQHLSPVEEILHQLQQHHQLQQQQQQQQQSMLSPTVAGLMGSSFSHHHHQMSSLYGATAPSMMPSAHNSLHLPTSALGIAPSTALLYNQHLHQQQQHQHHQHPHLALHHHHHHQQQQQPQQLLHHQPPVHPAVPQQLQLSAPQAAGASSATQVTPTPHFTGVPSIF